MGFSDDLVAEARAPKCKISAVREKMDKVDQKALDAAMENRDNVPTEVIIRALGRAQSDVKIGRKVVLKHRDKMCSCFEGNL